MLATIITAINHEGLSAPAKILWIKLFYKYGYEEFSGTYEEMAEEVGSLRWTVRDQIWKLQRANAVNVKDYFEKGYVGQMGNTYRFINPKDWE